MNKYLFLSLAFSFLAVAILPLFTFPYLGISVLWAFVALAAGMGLFMLLPHVDDYITKRRTPQPEPEPEVQAPKVYAQPIVTPRAKVAQPPPEPPKETPPKEETRMRKKTKQELINQIIAQLDDQANGNLPAVSAPQQTLSQRERERQGFKGWLRDLFDPVKKMHKEHELTRIATELSTGTEITKIRAAEAIEKATIYKQTAAKVYQHQAEEYRAIAELRTKAQAILAKKRDMRDIIEQLVEENFDQLLEEQATRELYELYLGRSKR